MSTSRSPVYSTGGMVAASQPLAVEIGTDILRKGGNAADAAIAVAAAMNVLQPCSTGIGGDAFCLYYDNSDQSVRGINGSGRAPAALTLDLAKDDADFASPSSLRYNSPHAVTVPGTCACWFDTLEHFGSGSLGMQSLLAPSIDLATRGFPVSGPWTAHLWAKGASKHANEPNFGEMLLANGKAPRAGQILRLPNLANTLHEVASKGRDGFYSGRIADAIVDQLAAMGGVMTTEDLATHVSTLDEPISVDYRGVRVWEIPPNGQGITALMGLRLLEQMPQEQQQTEPGSVERLHQQIECMRIAFADTRYYVADTQCFDVPIDELLSQDYAAKRLKMYYDVRRASTDLTHGYPAHASNTIYLSVVDKQGNACSFIQSNYAGFGTGIVPRDCGFTLQNRGCNFVLDDQHPNVLAPNKRPYHTIIPGMATHAESGALFACFGNMGGFMQPQGHLQLIAHLTDGMDPQQAIDSPRFCIVDGTHDGAVALEDGIDQTTINALVDMGHNIANNAQAVTGMNRTVFGRAQIIQRLPESDDDDDDDVPHVLCAGSDPRGDGLAMCVH